ncbi:hypothetical protein WJX77_004761 [Trebouxia sp. C0004]
MVHGGRCSLVGCRLITTWRSRPFWDRGPSTQASLCSSLPLPGGRAGANHKYTYRKEEPELGVGEAQRNHLQQRVESRVEVQVTGTLQGANKKLALEGTDGVCSGAAEQPPDYCRQQKRNALQQPDTVIPATHDVEVAAGKSPTFSTPASDSSTYLETSHRAVGNL